MQEIYAGKPTSNLKDIDICDLGSIALRNALETLAKLKPVFGNPTGTAGNSPGMNDGTTAQIFTKRKTAERLGMNVIYTIVTMSTIALQLRVMPVSPGVAIKKCLDEVKLSIYDMKFIEINEAFACAPLVSTKLLSNERFMKTAFNEIIKEVSARAITDNDDSLYSNLKKRLNVNGGAIAVGDSNTASGARIMMTAAYNLQENGGGYAAYGICGGLTQGSGCIIWVE